MTKGDQIQIPANIAEQCGVASGWYTCHGIGGIDASYKINGNELQVIDAGDLAGEDEGTIMAESPTHYDASIKGFTGTVQVLAGNGISLEIKDNVLIDIKSNGN